MIKTAVIIDDDPDDVELLREVITANYPIAVQTFTQPREALRHMVAMPAPPDFIFTDFNMPILKGDELVSMLRFNDMFNATVIAVLSTSMTEGTGFRLKTLGADFTYQKPATYTELVRIVATIFNSQDEQVPVHVK